MSSENTPKTVTFNVTLPIIESGELSAVKLDRLMLIRLSGDGWGREEFILASDLPWQEVKAVAEQFTNGNYFRKVYVFVGTEAQFALLKDTKDFKRGLQQFIAEAARTRDGDDYAPEQYIPRVYEKTGNIYGTFILQLRKCPSCKRLMISSKHNNEALGAQLNNANIVYQSEWSSDFPDLCVDCAHKRYDEAFICNNCNKEYPRSKLAWSVDRRDRAYLCDHCFDTMPARKWAEMTKDLEDSCDWQD